MDIILASSSKYRAQLLEQLALPFRQLAPQLDEEKLKVQLELEHPNNPKQIAIALAEAKARSIHQPNSVVIGGDQLVNLNGKILGKPGTHLQAINQLTSMQNHTHELITAICLTYQNQTFHLCDITKLTMRKLTTEQIEKYLLQDTPYDCAGSYKLEKHGIALFEKIESQDFSAIQGIPLIALMNLLDNLGIKAFS